MKIRNFKFEKSDYVVFTVIACLLVFSVYRSNVLAKTKIAKVCISSVYNLPNQSPNIEGVELYIEESGLLHDYKLVAAGSNHILSLPCIDVEAGQYIAVFTGSGENSCKRIYIGLKNKVLENEGGTVLLYKGSQLVGEYNY